MNLNNLFEAVRKEYYNMNVLEVATEFPLELLRIFFDMFEESIGEIDPRDKQLIVDEYRNNIDEKRNPWLDGRNDNSIAFDLKGQKQTPGDESNIIIVNFTGSKAKVNIKRKGGRTSSEATKWNASVTVREFFDKVINYYIKIGGEFSKEDKLNPELVMQEDVKVITLNKMWNKRYLRCSGGNYSKANEKYIDVKLDYSSFGKKLQYGKFAIRNDVNYSFQIELLEKFTLSFKKFMNNKNYIITNIIKEDKGLKFYYYFSENPDEDSPRNSTWSFERKQDEAFKNLDSLMKQYNITDMTFEEFKQDTVKNIFKVVK